MDRLVLPNAIVNFRLEEVRGPDGTRIDLRPRAFAVLRCLAAHAEKLVTKDHLLEECWPGVVVTEDSLTQCVSDIRQALGEGARDVVRTVPRRGYLLMPPDQTPSTSRADQPFEPTFRHLWPSIAVLPFDEFADKAGLGAAFADDLSTELARNRDLKVLARHVSFAAAARGMLPADLARAFQTRYVLGGSIRSAVEHITVNIQLIDGRHSCHVWAERFTASSSDVFATRGGLTARIATKAFSEIREAESVCALRGVPDDLGPDELARRGFAHLRGFSRADMVRGRAALERAIALDPNYAPAWICLGRLNAADAALCISGEMGQDAVRAAVGAIRHGIELAPTSAFGYQSLGAALSYLDRKDEALKAAQRSVELGPNDTDNLAFLGYALVEAGDCEGGLAHLQRAIALSPVTPPLYNNLMAFALIGLGRHEECLMRAVAAARQRPGYTAAYVNAAHALSALGRKREGKAHVTELLDHSPGFTIQTPITNVSYVRYTDIRPRYLDFLREVGVPAGS